jgi:alpha-beta hydrolase superfamily lysophospholipase
VARPAPTAPFADLRDAAFASQDGTSIRGWWVPPRNGAAVILCHGSGADRAQLLPEARILGTHGYGVLLFDLPGHGESGGRVVYGAPERQALTAAIDFVSAQPGVDARRIGVLGFSMGGAIAVQVAATDSRVRGLVLEGTYADANELFPYQYGAVMQWPARLAGWLAGTNAVEPVDAIGALKGRPVMILSGSDDTTVPSSMSRRLFDAAPEPKQFWLMAGAAHGDYARAAPDEYASRLNAFFDAALVRAGNSPT